MAEEIGQISVGLSLNDAGFNSSVSGINRSLKVLGAELGSIRAKGSEWGNSVEGLSQRQDALGRTLQVQEAKVSQLRDAYAKSAAETGEYSEKTQRLAQQLNKAVGEFNRTETELNGVKQALAAQQSAVTQTESKWNKLAQSMQEAGEKVSAAGQKMKDIGSTLTTGVTAPLLGFGAGAVKVANDVDSAQGRIQAQLGVTGQEAEKLESVATNVWKNAFGESLQEVTDNLAIVKQNMGDLNDTDLQKVLEGAYTLKDAFGAEINESTRTASVLMKNFGVDSQTALDLMTTGFQRGGNFSDELLDTMREYAPQFKGMGYDAEEFTAILIAGAESGAFNLDKVGDAAKEAFLRIGDGSKGSRDALGSLGLDFKQIEGDINSGGESAKSAFAAVASAIASVEDPAQQAQLAVALLGTPIEDLGPEFQTFFANVNTDLGNFEGSTKAAGDAMYDNFGSRLTTAFRELQTALLPLGEVLLSMAEAILPKLSAAVQTISEWFAKLTPAGQMITVIFGLIAAAIGPVLVVFGTIVGAIGNIITAVGPLLPYLSKLKTAFTVIRTAMLALTGPIGLAIAAITVLGVLIYKNWDTIKAKTIELFTTLKSYFATGWEFIKTSTLQFFTTLKSYFTTGWEYIKTTTMTVLNTVVTTIKTIWDGIKAYFVFVLNVYKTIFTTAWNGIKTAVTTVINAIKTTITTIMNGIKTVITTILNGIRAYYTTIFNAIRTVVTTVFNGIRTVITTVLNAIRSVTTTVWNGIKSVITTVVNSIKSTVTTVWNSIKSVITSVTNSIKSTVTSVWNSIKSTVTSVMNGIKSVISSVWNSAKSVVTSAVNGIKSIVTSVFNSLKSTVSSAMNGVRSAIESGWNRAKSFLSNINLSSIGRDIVQGLINGIKNKFSDVSRIASELAEKVKGAIKKVMDVNSPSRVTTQYGEWTSEGFAIGIQKKSVQAEKNAKNMAKKVSEAIKNAEVKFDTKKINADQYIATLKKIDAQHKLTGEQSRKIQKEIAATQAAKAKENDKEKALALQFYKSLDAINDKYVQKSRVVAQELARTERTLTEEYKNQWKERKKAIASFADLFSIVETKQVDPTSLITALESQVGAINQYSNAINELKRRGLNKDIVTELEAKGPNAAAEIATLAAFTDEQLAQYQRLYDEKNKLAVAQTTKEMAEERAELARKIEAERNKAKETMGAYKTAWVKEIQDLKTKTLTEMGSLTTGMRSAGKNAAAGLIEGMNSMRGPLEAAAKALANSVSSSLKGALKIKSPSRLLRDEVGAMIPAGIAVGMDQYKDLVSNAAQSLAQVAMPNTNFEKVATRNAQIQAATATPVQAGSNHITIEVPVNLDGYEVARIAQPYIDTNQQSKTRQKSYMKGV